VFVEINDRCMLSLKIYPCYFIGQPVYKMYVHVCKVYPKTRSITYTLYFDCFPSGP